MGFPHIVALLDDKKVQSSLDLAIENYMKPYYREFLVIQLGIDYRRSRQGFGCD